MNLFQPVAKRLSFKIERKTLFEILPHHLLNQNESSLFTLKKFFIDYIHNNGCARRGASGALFPKSASCGVEFPLKGSILEAYRPI
jgi:hypothetical protein